MTLRYPQQPKLLPEVGPPGRKDDLVALLLTSEDHLIIGYGMAEREDFIYLASGASGNNLTFDVFTITNEIQGAGQARWIARFKKHPRD